MTKLLYSLIFITSIGFALTACESLRLVPAPIPALNISEEEPVEVVAETPEPLPQTRPQIVFISKGYENSFGEMLITGASDAAEKHDAVLIVREPEKYMDSASQAEIIKLAIEESPSAICIAAVDAETAAVSLESAKKKGIPIIGFEIGVPNAPKGLIMSSIQTDNYAAGAMAAESVFASPYVVEKIRNAKPSSPVTFTVLAKDAQDAFVDSRIRGFLDKMTEKASAINSAGVQAMQISDGDAYAEYGACAVMLTVISSPDCRAAASLALENADGLIGLFCSGEEAAEGLLAATSEGLDLDRTRGTYKELMVIGFEAGAKQKNAVKNQHFYSAVAEDPYAMGYKAIEIAYEILQGDSVPETIDPGCWLYSRDNMYSKQIEPLLYD